MSVGLETQAKLYIQEWIRNGRFELVTSEMLTAEVNECPFEERRSNITDSDVKRPLS